MGDTRASNATDCDNQLTRTNCRAKSASSPPDSAGAREAVRVSVSEPRPTTIIRAPTFSVHALAHAMRELIAYRDLLYTLSVHRLKVRYKQSVLGPAWAVLQPLLLMLIFTVVFSRIVRACPATVFLMRCLHIRRSFRGHTFQAHCHRPRTAW